MLGKRAFDSLNGEVAMNHPGTRDNTPEQEGLEPIAKR